MEKEEGLTEKEAKENLEKYGYNEIQEVMVVSKIKILLRQIKKNSILYLLLIASLISFFVGKSITGYTIIFIIAIIISVGFFQEYKAETSIKSLKKMIMPISIVIREGKEREIPSNEIVPGDILVLRIGEKIPADCLVLSQKELRVDESILTGESGEVEKKDCKNEKTCEKESSIFMGTHIINGKCIAKVIHTGMNTEFGKIAGLISTAEKELLLQKKVNAIARYMALFGASLAILTGILYLLKNLPITYENVVEILVIVIAIAVASFPEGFPVVLISTLSAGAYRMAQKNAIVNRMSIIETLGETTVICSDKTGTITTGEMTVKKIFANNNLFDVSGAGYKGEGEILFNNEKIKIKNELTLNLLVRTGILCNDSAISRTGNDMEFHVKGNPTEASLLVLGSKLGKYKEDFRLERAEEAPFNSERKMMSVLIKEGKEDYFIYSKGALEYLLKKCTHIQRNNGIFTLTKKEIDIILAENKKLNSNSFRTLALAYRKVKEKKTKNLEEGLVFLGIVGIEDPPRTEVKEAIRLCHEAGIKVKMITGDNKDTAISVAKRINLDEGKVMTGEEIDRLSEHELSRIVRDVVIFARVKPEHKLKIVRALKANKEIVTMTGDGVNDAPALKEAHIGVAMGKKGTDVSREASDLIIKDDNFVTIVEAIKEGRTIFSNIQKFSTYQISINFAQASLIFFAILIGLPIPLLPLQILFMNILSDETTAITLGFNPASLDAMKSKPKRNAGILNKELFKMIATAGMLMAVCSLVVFSLSYYIWHNSIDMARTLTFVVMVLFGLTHAFNFRSFRYPVHKLPLFANKYLVYACLVSLFATLLVVYTPLNKIFYNIIFPAIYWVPLVAFSFLAIIVFDVWKVIKAKKSHGFNSN
jgi:Ca2+-transporting ATPase